MEEKAKANLTQEVAKSNHGQPPPNYVLKEEDRPDVDLPVASDIPVIDIGRLFRSDDEGVDEAEKLGSALRCWGLFQAIGHGMSASILDEMHDAAMKFFHLPMEIKQKYSNLKEGFGYKKFEGYGNDLIEAEEQIHCWNDILFLSVQPEDQRNLELWPESPSSFRAVLHEYTKGVRNLAEQVLYAVAKLLGLDDMYFIHQLDGAQMHARFNYYPQCARPDLVLGLKPHSDGSFITILLLDKEVEGLQVLKDDKWVKVPIIPHALFVNVGDQMEIMCNGIFKSPVHRAVVGPKERMSLVMFYQPEQEKDLEPAPGVVDVRRPRLYKKVSVKDFNKAYVHYALLGKNTLDWLKV